MILVSVGTHNQGFERLVRAMDELAAELEETVIIQYGSSTYIPVHAEHFQWATSQQMWELTCQARVIVCHAAAGAIISGLQAGKPLVVVPRSKEYSEHIDDHQMQLAFALHQTQRAIWVLNISSIGLLEAITNVVLLPNFVGGAKQLTSAILQRINSWAQEGSM